MQSRQGKSVPKNHSDNSRHRMFGGAAITKKPKQDSPEGLFELANRNMAQAD